MNEGNPFREIPKDAAAKSGAGVPPAAFLLQGGGLKIRYRRLPHWEIDNAVYFVTFRLYDSLPKDARKRILALRQEIVATAAEMG